MKIEGKRYVIATKKYPILFDGICGNSVNEIKDAKMYEDKSQADGRLSCFDGDCIDDWCVVEVSITYIF